MLPSSPANVVHKMPKVSNWKNGIFPKTSALLDGVPALS